MGFVHVFVFDPLSVTTTERETANIFLAKKSNKSGSRVELKVLWNFSTGSTKKQCFY